jgi:hypothetical protein
LISNTTPPPPATGHQHPKCYAAGLSDCSDKISKEHYVSKSVLLAIGERPEASGLAFLADEKPLPPAVLTSKILCERHNHALSPLDAAATEFFNTLRGFDAGLADDVAEPSAETRTSSGDDVERWCLKTLAGLVHAKAVSSSGLRPELRYPEILFSGRPWPPHWGLSVSTSGEQRYAFRGLGVNTQVNEADGSIWAAEFNIAGFSFLLHFGRAGGISAAYRPSGIRFARSKGSATKTLLLRWSGGSRSDLVLATQVGRYKGPRPFAQ